MNDRAHGAGHNKSNICWGKIIAGAAIVAGVVLLAPHLFPNIADSIATGFKSLFSITPSAGESIFSKIGTALASDTARNLGGATLLGGGLMYLFSGKKEEHDGHQHIEQESYRTKVDMERMQNLMVMRAAYAGNPQAQAMMMQQQGR